MDYQKEYETLMELSHYIEVNVSNRLFVVWRNREEKVSTLHTRYIEWKDLPKEKYFDNWVKTFRSGKNSFWYYGDYNHYWENDSCREVGVEEHKALITHYEEKAFKEEQNKVAFVKFEKEKKDRIKKILQKVVCSEFVRHSLAWKILLWNYNVTAENIREAIKRFELSTDRDSWDTYWTQIMDSNIVSYEGWNLLLTHSDWTTSNTSSEETARAHIIQYCKPWVALHGDNIVVYNSHAMVHRGSICDVSENLVAIPQDEIESVRNRLSKKIMTIESIKEALKEIESIRKEEFIASWVFDLVSTHELFERWEFTSWWVVLHTKPLYINTFFQKDSRNNTELQTDCVYTKDYLIWEFEIEVRRDWTTRVRWKHKVSWNQTPHINREWRFCYGNAETLLTGYAKSLDLLNLFSHVTTHICTYNDTSPFMRLYEYLCDIAESSHIKWLVKKRYPLDRPITGESHTNFEYAGQ